VAQCLGSAAAYVQPTRYESQGVAILEAMAIGLPIITTRIPAVTEFVEQGRNGFLVPPDDAGAVADALVRLARAPSRAAAMSAANHTKAASYDWSVSSRLLVDCLGLGAEARA
jgi:glycosyltransferase involved in cell wall biosynthesis